jgi:type VI secretion system Hcp family effector
LTNATLSPKLRRMHKSLLAFAAVLCLALPLSADDDQGIVSLTVDTDAAEVVLSATWGVDNVTAEAAGAATGRRKHKALEVTKEISKSSPSLFKACVNGKHITTVVITHKKKGGSKPVEYLEIKLTDATITSYSVRSDSGFPIETISFESENAEYRILGGQ